MPLNYIFILLAIVWSYLLHKAQGLSFDMKTIESNQQSHRLRHLNSTKLQTFDNIYHIMTVEICLGRPHQCFSLLYDTGMSYMVLADSNTPSAEFKNSFNVAKSQSVRPATFMYQLPYRTGILKAREMIDYASIGDTQPSFGFNLLLAYSTSERYNFDGILGLSRFYPEKNEGNQFDKRFSFIDYLQFNKLIKHKMFAHEYLNRTYGKFYIDELPKSFGNNYQTCSNEPFDPMNYHWYCQMRSVSFSTGENFTEISSKAIFNTGFVNVRGPLKEGTIIFNHFLKIAGDQCEIEDKLTGSQVSYQKMKCKEDFNVKKFPHLTFNLKGMQLTLFNEDMFRLIERDGERLLISKIILDNRYEYWELGEPVLKNYNMLFDYEKNIIGSVPNINFEGESWTAVIMLSLILLGVLGFSIWFYMNRRKLFGHKIDSNTINALNQSGEMLNEYRK